MDSKWFVYKNDELVQPWCAARIYLADSDWRGDETTPRFFRTQSEAYHFAYIQSSHESYARKMAHSYNPGGYIGRKW